MIYLEFFGQRRRFPGSVPASRGMGARSAVERPGMGQYPMEQNWNNGPADAICGKPARGRVEAPASV